jgi:ribulose bisphosphate carboxylase small subunit
MPEPRPIRSVDEFRRRYLPRCREELWRAAETPAEAGRRIAREALKELERCLSR